jgi:hypothetical protein
MTLSPTAHLPLPRKGLLVPILLAMFTGMVLFGLYSVSRVLFLGDAPARSASQPPVASLALAAYWDKDCDKPGKLCNLIVEGRVAASKAQEPPAHVKLTLRRLKTNFRQSYMVDVQQGKFRAPYVEGFTGISRNEPIHLVAETSLTQPSEGREPLIEEVYLNTLPPIFSTVPLYPLLLVGILLLFGTFLFAFTGKSSSFKNHLAILFGYIVISLFLAFPLLAPVVLPLAFPETFGVIQRTPVGLVVTKVASEPESGPQWALNIGGYIPETTDPSNAEGVKVEGGLTIPLYVILLSIIGGAINMTRQVPKFQEEEASATWRTELLNQYMFLISAPFLAIATYYMLIGLNLTKVPVMVLMAFSVGLISESILRIITDTAVRFLHHQPSAASPATGTGNAIPAGTTVPTGATPAAEVQAGKMAAA